jgi:X-X-X-Leu-X-X-Gly heptad repeat protein
MQKVTDGMPEVADGMQKVTDGMPEVADGMQKVTVGMQGGHCEHARSL